MSYKAVFHVDLDDDQRFNLALNNITNTLNALKDTETDFVLLANGPGVTMLSGNKVLDYLERINQLLKEGVRFLACSKALEKFNIAHKDLAEGIEVISAGIVGIIDFQNAGFAYIKP